MRRFDDAGPRVLRRCLRRLIPLLALALLADPIRAADLPPAGAPPAGSGSIEVPWARVIDGDTLEVWIDGSRVGVGLIGVRAPQLNTACGQEAALHMERLVARGVRLDEDAALVFDRRLRRMYDVVTPEGGSVAEALVWAGVVRVGGQGARRRTLASLQDEARAAGRGCLWSAE